MEVKKKKKLHLFAVAFLIVGSLFLGNCDKNEVLEGPPAHQFKKTPVYYKNSKDVSLKEATDYFNKLTNNNKLSRGKSNKTIDFKITPDWSSLKQCDLFFTNSQMVMMNAKLNVPNDHEATVVFINISGELESYLLTLYPEKKDKNGNITDGQLYINRLNGHLVNSYYIRNSNIYGKIFFEKQKKKINQAGFFSFNLLPLQGGRPDCDFWTVGEVAVPSINHPGVTVNSTPIARTNTFLRPILNPYSRGGANVSRLAQNITQLLNEANHSLNKIAINTISRVLNMNDQKTIDFLNEHEELTGKFHYFIYRNTSKPYVSGRMSPRAKEFAKNAIDLLYEINTDPTDGTVGYERKIKKMTNHIRKWGGKNETDFANYIDAITEEFDSMSVGEVFDIYEITKEAVNDLTFEYAKVFSGPFVESVLGNGAFKLLGKAVSKILFYSAKNIANISIASNIITKLPDGLKKNNNIFDKVSKIIGNRVAKGGKNFVYISKNANGVVDYAGITNNLARRAAEQLSSKGIRIQKLMGGLSRSDARAVEQALIEIHGLGKNGGTLLNKINSISPKNPVYGQQLQRGYDLLKSIGY